MPDDHSIRQANRLYWETGASVGDIADQLELSRRALYDAIEPRPAPQACPECGGSLVFRNRTSLERGQAECLDCEVEQTVAGPPDVDRGTEPQVEQEAAASRLSPMTRRGPAGDTSAVALAGSLLAGLAVGAAAAYLVRQR